MKKFRFFSLIAIIAAFSTVFAAWQYVNYANEYASDPAELKVSIDDATLESSEALSVAIDNASAVTINYVQSEADAFTAVANISDDINITVTEAEEGAIEQYDFYYAVFSDIEVGSLKDISEYETADGVDYEKLTALEIGEDGKAVISKDIIAGLFEHQFAENADNFEKDFNTFKGKVMALQPQVKIYANKKA